MNKLVLAMGALLIVLTVLLSSALTGKAAVTAERDALATGLNQAATQRKLDEKVLAARQAENAATGRKLAQSKAALAEALQRNTSWSEADVPPVVIEALGGAGKGLHAPSE